MKQVNREDLLNLHLKKMNFWGYWDTKRLQILILQERAYEEKIKASFHTEFWNLQWTTLQGEKAFSVELPQQTVWEIKSTGPNLWQHLTIRNRMNTWYSYSTFYLQTVEIVWHRTLTRTKINICSSNVGCLSALYIQWIKWPIIYREVRCTFID